jgi:membrane-anchored glycerophosphoryl diester phosphodiesterase (GDPDase)
MLTIPVLISSYFNSQFDNLDIGRFIVSLLAALVIDTMSPQVSFVVAFFISTALILSLLCVIKEAVDREFACVKKKKKEQKKKTCKQEQSWFSIQKQGDFRL